MIRRPSPLVFGATLAAALAGSDPAAAADPTLSDCIAANESSLEARAEHKLREARAQALLCAADSCPAEMRDKCKQRVEQLNAAIPTIVFAVQDPSGADLGVVRVSMDGALLLERLEGTAVSLDPGEHTFTFEAGAQPAVRKTLILREGEKDRRERIVLGEPATRIAAPSVTETTAGAASTIGHPPLDEARTSSGRHNWKTEGLVIGAVGIAGLVAGGTLGALAASNWSSSKNACGSPADCPNRVQAVSDHDRAWNLATASDAFFIGGGALLAVGAALLWAAPSEGGVSAPAAGFLVAPELGPRSQGLRLQATF